MTRLTESEKVALLAVAIASYARITLTQALFARGRFPFVAQG